MDRSGRLNLVIQATVTVLVVALLAGVAEEDPDLEARIVIAAVIIVLVGTLVIVYDRRVRRSN